jgi:hypothetical protein
MKNIGTANLVNGAKYLFPQYGAWMQITIKAQRNLAKSKLSYRLEVFFCGSIDIPFYQWAGFP